MVPENCCMVLLSVWLMSFPVQVTITTTVTLPTLGESVSCKRNRQYVQLVQLCLLLFNRECVSSTYA